MLNRLTSIKWFKLLNQSESIFLVSNLEGAGVNESLNERVFTGRDVTSIHSLFGEETSTFPDPASIPYPLENKA